jgi:hypothetical protein
MDHQHVLLFYFEKGSTRIQNSEFWYIQKIMNIYFSSNFDAFFVVECIVLRAFDDMSADFLFLLRFLRKT